jgi:hypothetical protein
LSAAEPAGPARACDPSQSLVGPDRDQPSELLDIRRIVAVEPSEPS